MVTAEAKQTAEIKALVACDADDGFWKYCMTVVLKGSSWSR